MSDETDFETCFETNAPGQVQRLDVIESPRGKRHWTPEARAQIIAESLERGANVSAVARRHGMFPQRLYTWRRGLRERAEAMTFVPAMVERGKVNELSSAAVPPVSGQIIVEASGLLIRIPPDVSADQIERVPSRRGQHLRLAGSKSGAAVTSPCRSTGWSTERR